MEIEEQSGADGKRPPPPWAHSVSRLHGLGLLSVRSYEHPRVGAPSRAFCRRMHRVERRSRAVNERLIAKYARTLRLTVARFGFRGATDSAMAAFRHIFPRWRAAATVPDCRGDWARRARFLFGLIERAFADLSAARCGS